MRVEALNLGFSYDEDIYVFKDLNFSVGDGELLLVVGDNGSGKTTLLQIVALLLKPTHGKVIFDGEDPWKDPNRWRKRIGFSFQFPENQFFNFTVFDEVVYSAKNFGLDGIERLYERSMAAFGMDPESYRNRLPFELSGGEKRKVGIASVVVHDPDLLILDEPLVSLDWPSRCEIKSFLKGWKDMGKTAVVATHYPDFFSSIADGVLRLS